MLKVSNTSVRVTITKDLKWNTHISNVGTKANRTLGFLDEICFLAPKM